MKWTDEPSSLPAGLMADYRELDARWRILVAKRDAEHIALEKAERELAEARKVATRPPWDEPLGVECNCGARLKDQESFRAHWQSGHFDVVRALDAKEGR